MKYVSSESSMDRLCSNFLFSSRVLGLLLCTSATHASLIFAPLWSSRVRFWEGFSLCVCVLVLFTADVVLVLYLAMASIAADRVESFFFFCFSALFFRSFVRSFQQWRTLKDRKPKTCVQIQRNSRETSVRIENFPLFRTGPRRRRRCTEWSVRFHRSSLVHYTKAPSLLLKRVQHLTLPHSLPPSLPPQG